MTAERSYRHSPKMTVRHRYSCEHDGAQAVIPANVTALRPSSPRTRGPILTLNRAHFYRGTGPFLNRVTKNNGFLRSQE